MARQLRIPAADTQLYAVDAPGGTPALLFLSGGFGTVRNWSRVIRGLDGKYRTVRFDARARGKSGRSADYSAQAAVDDIGRVVDELGPDFTALKCPTVFVVGSGAHSGATEDEMRTVRAAVADAERSNERVSVFVVAAIEDVIHGSS